MRQYRSKLFQDPNLSSATNRKPREAVGYIDDLLSVAGKEKLDVFMLVEALNASWRDDLHKQVNDRTFADALRWTLSQGSNVSIFVWNELKSGVISPEMLKLIEEVKQEPEKYPGKLRVKFSYTTERSSELLHFLIVTEKSGKGDQWYCRVEENAADHTSADEVTGEYPEVPATIEKENSKAARELGAPLLRFFKQLMDLEPSASYNEQECVSDNEQECVGG